MIEVVLRRPGRVVRVRVVEAKQLGTELARAPLGREVVLGPNEKSPARTFLRRVRQPEGVEHVAIAPEERAAAFVRIRLDSMLTNSVRHPGAKLERH